MRIVVDANVAVKWVIRESGQAEARRLLEVGDELRAPDLLMLEAASVLARRARMGDMTATDAANIFAELQRFPLQLDPGVPLLPSAFRLSLELSHSVYDCIYLALAQELETVVVTADRRFAAACLRGGYGGRVQALV